MNIKSLVFAAVAAASLSPAFAEEQIFDSSKIVSTKSRSEVLADLEIYRVSGLAELERHDNVAFASPAYLHAKRLYAGLRSSNNFDRLVTTIAKQRGEMIDMAGNEVPVRAAQ
ncbi:hypothetical protein [Caldimonas sp. KR1-144]|uniref:hypothetical protein n=1 Tax=Caldimonas sp. KR1-144 TaxID=3400911 RepID=UPI003BFEDD52